MVHFLEQGCLLKIEAAPRPPNSSIILSLPQSRVRQMKFLALFRAVRSQQLDFPANLLERRRMELTPPSALLAAPPSASPSREALSGAPFSSLQVPPSARNFCRTAVGTGRKCLSSCMRLVVWRAGCARPRATICAIHRLAAAAPAQLRQGANAWR